MIRAYRKDDYDAVVALVTSVLAEYGFAAHIGGVQRDLAAIVDGYSSGGFWVAEIDGAIAGTVAIRPKEGATCELKRLYVKKDARGHGLGRALYAHAEAFARQAFELVEPGSHRQRDAVHQHDRRRVAVAGLDHMDTARIVGIERVRGVERLFEGAVGIVVVVPTDARRRDPLGGVRRRARSRRGGRRDRGTAPGRFHVLAPSYRRGTRGPIPHTIS